MSDTQYKVLQDLFHEYNEAFHALPNKILEAYYDRLYSTQYKVNPCPVSRPCKRAQS